MTKIRNTAFLLMMVIVQASLSGAQLTYTGVNLATAAFDGDYSYPTAEEVDYFIGKGTNMFRLPFKWERLQPTLGQSFNTTEFEQLNTFVNYATSKGATVILDPHNFDRYNGNLVGSSAVPDSAFADLWSRLASAYKGNNHVVFGLMNEPYGLPTEQWVTSANAAISAIRQTSAKNLLLVPGNAYSGGYSWDSNFYGTPNSVAMLNIQDPDSNFAFDIHQYLDSDSSGTTAGTVSPTIGEERLKDVTSWLEGHGYKAFLGEFAVANSTIGSGADQIGDEAINNMLDYMQANSQVWLGWSWWAAGERWGDYMFTMEPTNLGLSNQADQPSMTLIQPRLVGVPEPQSMALIAALALGKLLRRVPKDHC